MSSNIVYNNLTEAHKLLNSFISNHENIQLIEFAAQKIVSSLKSGNKILSCGNGGSMSDAMHFAEELTGRFRDNRKAIAAIAISDPSHITCTANDYGYNKIFSRYIEAIAKPNDILLAISTSGNSENIIEAIKEAKKNKMFCICLTGKDGGKISKLADIEIRVPHFGYADRIQEIHIMIIHSLIHYIEKTL